MNIKSLEMITMSNDFNISKMLMENNCALVPADHFSFSQESQDFQKVFKDSWNDLEIDRYMADGGTYRLRRYGEFHLRSGTLTYQPDAVFYQSLKINHLNGGQDRKFPPLSKATIENKFLHSLICFDFNQLPKSTTSLTPLWRIGIHQIKIKAIPGYVGNPTPEGIHRDDEKYTVQHLIHRHNIEGGVNYFHGHGKIPSEKYKTKWLQKNLFDSFYFNKLVWHSVSPVSSTDGVNDGYRDVILIDFVPIEDAK